MKIIILGDIHYPSRTDDLSFLDKIKEENPDIIISTGDYTDEVVIKELRNIAKFYGVKGNCDYLNLPEELELEIFGKKYYVIHSSQFGRGNIDALIKIGTEKSVDFLVFGHTHKPFLQNIGKLTLINPGSITGCLPGDKSIVPKSYVIIENNKIIFRLE